MAMNLKAHHRSQTLSQPVVDLGEDGCFPCSELADCSRRIMAGCDRQNLEGHVASNPHWFNSLNFERQVTVMPGEYVHPAMSVHQSCWPEPLPTGCLPWIKQPSVAPISLLYAFHN
jgi:hypothetical protein